MDLVPTGPELLHTWWARTPMTVRLRLLACDRDEPLPADLVDDVTATDPVVVLGSVGAASITWSLPAPTWDFIEANAHTAPTPVWM